MRKIKFRGTTPSGETVFGDLTHERNLTFINDRRVDPNSVLQLVGFDDTGDEIYVGDEFTDANGNKLVAALVPCLVNRFTGYLVGTLDRWNDAKKSEERERVKHEGGDNYGNLPRMRQDL